MPLTSMLPTMPRSCGSQSCSQQFVCGSDCPAVPQRWYSAYDEASGVLSLWLTSGSRDAPAAYGSSILCILASCRQPCLKSSGPQPLQQWHARNFITMPVHHLLLQADSATSLARRSVHISRALSATFDIPWHACDCYSDCTIFSGSQCMVQCAHEQLFFSKMQGVTLTIMAGDILLSEAQTFQSI